LAKRKQSAPNFSKIRQTQTPMLAEQTRPQKYGRNVGYPGKTSKDFIDQKSNKCGTH
jgi:hypothetical protein